MKINAEIVFRRNEGYGVVCDWKGPRNGIAKLYGEDIIDESVYPARRLDTAKVYELGRLKLRVIEFPCFNAAGAGASDYASVMLESPHAQLFHLYREKAEIIIRLAMRFEAAYNAFRFKCNHGSRMPFTSKIADLLL